jgi:polyhydroxyalkanoate synthesis repressor PhaR
MTDASNDTKTKLVTIKKYANRRLYNTATSSYVTLEDLAVMIKEGIEFAVYDAKSGDDITHSVLTHIIVEQESKGQNLLPVGFLRHLISFYGDSLESVVPTYLEHSMQSFAKNQDQMRNYVQDSFGGGSPFSAFEDVGKQNMAMFEQTMSMFSPFTPDNKPGSPPSAEPSSSTDTDDLASLKDQLAAMQVQLNKMSKG